jgi:Holliday junction resolvase
MGGSFRFTISGPPMGKNEEQIAKGSDRLEKVNTANYEKRVKNACVEKCEQRQPDYTGQVAVDITAFYPNPSSFTPQKQEEMRGSARPVKKPDLDNISKIVLDALNHVAWQDNKQVVCMVLSKKYADVPCVSVGVCYLD